jgi:D-alanyl-D-alanine carboxypeptidase
MGNFYTDMIRKDKRFKTTKPVADPKLLEPVTRDKVAQIIADAAKQGIKLMISETYRSQARQLHLFEQHATQLKKVGVHHYGLACDLVKDVNGHPSWKGDFKFLRALAKKHGLIWGGDWGRPNVKPKLYDPYHVQRCTVARQKSLFNGTWYPDENYDPYKG